MIVSHPIQYYVPLYRRLARRDDVELKVFYTWQANPAKFDPGFQRNVSWDVPLTEGYEYEVVPNVSKRPGSDHFLGIRNPRLVNVVSDWKPDAVHITGYAYASHLNAMRVFGRRGVPVLFRGDSHLLDQKPGLRWQVKRLVLGKVFKWPAICLYVGKNNYDYFRAMGVPDSRLSYCPHCIDVARFAEPNEELESRARVWRRGLGISEKANVLLFAGKFEPKKRPIELMEAVNGVDRPDIILVMVGNGELEPEVHRIAKSAPDRYRVLPFQNQSLMPVVYRLGDIFVLPSAYNETWGLALNEAISCGRRVLASNHVGGAIDLVKSSREGAVFAVDDWGDFRLKIESLLKMQNESVDLREFAKSFDISATEESLVSALQLAISDTDNL